MTTTTNPTGTPFGHRAFVLGYTGECGRMLVRRLIECGAFKHVVLIGRRYVTNDGSEDGEVFAKCVSTFQNFHFLDKLIKLFSLRGRQQHQHLSRQ
jgi:hypothetical protein